MKKVLVCALAALFLMASCVTAFATTIVGDVTYSTTTAYTTEGTLKVETTVTGAAEGTMLTYLAYKGDAANKDTIKYIDQQTAEEGKSITFSYETDKDNLTGTTVKFGADTQATATVEEESNRARVITIKLGDDSERITLPIEVVTSDYPTKFTVEEGYEITAATRGEENVMDCINKGGDNTIYFTDNAKFADGDEIIITVTETAVDPVAAVVSSVRAAAGRYKYSGEDTYTEKLTMFAKATSNKKAPDFGGIIITTDETIAADEDAFVIGTDGVNKYEAYFKGADGSFAVQLLNETNEKDLTNGSYYGRIYVTSDNDGDETVYSEIFHFEATVEAE